MQYYQECVALGSKTGFSLVSEADAGTMTSLYRELWRRVFMFERQFSRFLPGSELSLFNRGAGTKQPVSPEFRDLLLVSRTLAQSTDGLYNPFLLPALQAAGYVHSRVPGREQDVVDDFSDKAIGDIDMLEIGDNWARIPYGTAIDLGGCGKGYLADQLRTLLPDIITGYWLSFGGDIAIGGHDERDKPWKVTIQSADDQSNTIGSLTSLKTCGIATSGTTVHRGIKGGKAWHHLIDPRTHKPAKTDVLLATVCDESSLQADVLASCAVILGSTKGMEFLKAKGVQSAVLQCRNPHGKNQIIHFGNGILIEVAHA